MVVAVEGRVPGLTRSRKVRRSFAAALFALACVAAFDKSAWFHRQVLLSFTERTQHFTQLYFPDYAKVAKTIPAGLPDRIPFEVVNDEGRPETYGVQISVSPATNGPTPSKESISVAAGQSAIGWAQFTPETPGRTYVVLIRLVGRPESVHIAVSAATR